MDRSRQVKLLSRGLIRLGVQPEPSVVDRLLEYIALLRHWNRRINLTAVRDAERMISHHLLDSLALLPHLRGKTLLDAGSGAGLPGIPLAVMRPDLAVTLVDSVGKKVRFLNHVVRTLGLRSVQTVHARVEQYAPRNLPRTITVRALGSVSELLQLTGHLMSGETVLLAMKGQYPEQELLALPAGFVVKSVHELQIPGLDAERHVVVLCRESAAESESIEK